MRFDRILRYAHLRRDLALWQAFDAAKDESLARLGRHRRDRAGELAQFIPIDRMLLGRGRIVGRIEPLEIIDRVDRDDPRAANMASDDRARDLEQIGARIIYGVDGLELGEDRIGFLDDVVSVEPRQRAPHKPAAKRRLVRQDIAQQPVCSFPVDAVHP